MSLWSAWASLSWSAAAAVELGAVLLVLLGCAIGSSAARRPHIRRRAHESARGRHFFKNVFDPYFRTWK